MVMIALRSIIRSPSSGGHSGRSSAAGSCRGRSASGVMIVAGGPGSRRRERMLRMTSAEWTPSLRASAQAASTAGRPWVARRRAPRPSGDRRRVRTSACGAPVRARPAASKVLELRAVAQGAGFAGQVPMAFHSFGGWKASIFGDHHMHGPEGVRFYTRLKTITIRRPTGMRTEAEFVMPTMG